MAEDWRVTVTLEDEQEAHDLLDTLAAHEVDHALKVEMNERVAVSGEGNEVFLYADDRRAAEAAERVVRALAPPKDRIDSWQLERWHHEEERWEDGSVPLPQTQMQHAAEHARLESEETAESQKSGLAEWEVRVEFASHHDAKAFAEREQAEGRAIARRWKYVLIGVNDRDDADALARRLQAELPPGARLHVEPGSGLSWELMPTNPFAVFGGLGA
jgi:hypothetical protein